MVSGLSAPIGPTLEGSRAFSLIAAVSGDPERVRGRKYHQPWANTFEAGCGRSALPGPVRIRQG